jgi:hypothetical protein
MPSYTRQATSSKPFGRYLRRLLGVLVAAGVTDYALLALFPATASPVSLHGLFTAAVRCGAAELDGIAGAINRQDSEDEAAKRDQRAQLPQEEAGISGFGGAQREPVWAHLWMRLRCP